MWRCFIYTCLRKHVSFYLFNFWGYFCGFLDIVYEIVIKVNFNRSKNGTSEYQNINSNMKWFSVYYHFHKTYIHVRYSFSFRMLRRNSRIIFYWKFNKILKWGIIIMAESKSHKDWVYQSVNIGSDNLSWKCKHFQSIYSCLIRFRCTAQLSVNGTWPEKGVLNSIAW